MYYIWVDCISVVNFKCLKAVTSYSFFGSSMVHFSGSSMYVFLPMAHQCVLLPNYFSGSSMYVFRPLAHRVDLIGQRGIWGIGHEVYAFTHETKVSNCCSTETLSAVSSRMSSVCKLTTREVLTHFPHLLSDFRTFLSCHSL